MRTGQGDTEQPAHGASRFEKWRSGWRVALRMARRDVRRHRGRSVLITVMVGLPVLLLVAGSTLWFSNDLNSAERLPLQVGQSQGYLVGPRPEALKQLLDPYSSYDSGAEGQVPAPARPVPGYGPGTQERALEDLVGGRLHHLTMTYGTARVGKHLLHVQVLGADGSARGAAATLAPRVTLSSGRWPAGPGEVLVTPVGVAEGLPASGTFELGIDVVVGDHQERQTQQVTVVGTGQGFQVWGAQQISPVGVITTPTEGPMEGQWLVERSAPITWPEIERLNTYGVGTYSRYVAQHPDTMNVPSEYTARSDDTLFVVGSAALGLLLLTSLLAGPAFAVSAARQRRTLALAASNGATRAQLRRSVLAQALVLGVLSSLAGAVVGVVGGLAGALVLGRFKPYYFLGPLEVPWTAVAIVVAAGILSSVVAALVPSRGLGKLDIVSILRGQSVSAPLRAHIPVVGAILAGIGVGAVLYASFRSQGVYVFVFLGGVLLLVVGALLMVPLVLAVGARLSQRLPLAGRMAAREAGRLRGRATPTVAAIMAGAAVLATVCIALQADTVRSSRNYQPQTLEGQAVLNAWGPGETLSGVLTAVQRAEPSLHALVVRGDAQGTDDTSTRLAAVRPGCTPDETIPEIAEDPNGPPSTAPGDRPPPCATLALSGSAPGTRLIVVDLDELADFVDLTEAQRAALAKGGLAVLDPTVTKTLPVQDPFRMGNTDIDLQRPVDVDVADGAVGFYRYEVTPKPDGYDVDAKHTDQVELPIVPLSHEQWVRLAVGWFGVPGGLITTETAASLGVETAPDMALLRGDSAITPAQEQRLVDAAASVSPEATVTVERGFQRSDGLVIAIVIAVIALVILVATLIATALGQAEAAPLLGTLAAVGATRRTRRAMAGAQATYLALLGAVLGVLVGIAPGIAISRIITANYTEDGIDLSGVVIDIPWLQILLPVLLVPLVAGALAWVSIRRAPVVTRRST
ncbi:MAG: ABC transporter permease [Intrasporangium sp.]|uniref:ABC transporter permease n=1 Tax=Intrasporangium sp. TaxID=1925024 RepID=UPI00264943FF|nr:ABC transporter permease [Intrasporangium sp.]MDN5795171.1 ABC transporter permease [Intrasporangium sp.]